MNASPHYHIRIAGELPENWSDWFAGLEIQPLLGGETRLSGELPDQAALIGLLVKLHSLNITLLEFERSAAAQHGQ